MIHAVTKRLPALVYFAWAYALLWLLDGYRYAYFLHYKLWFIIALGLGITIFFHLSSLFRPSAGHGHGQALSALGQWSRAGILLLPLVFLLFSYDQSLGAYAYEKRALSSAPQLAVEGMTFPFPGQDVTKKDEPDLLELFLNSTVYDGATVSTKGKVYWRKDAPEGSFQLYRFIIVCCAADAQPAGLLVRGGPNASLQDDDWVTVTGTFHQIDLDGNKEWCLDATAISPIEEPEPRKQYLQYPMLF